ncbi:hypothetical protein CK203_032500 [Vitis vinifera]|uniref:Reverse transcriptase zinc-binding domain-containing protein n=1 Tax=Vitis vinifera TaxID=29760 RepID=A0A438I6W4_VITVI|nr:hypothetical protein CK203_032500 [Vitis vinifera]
MVGDLLHVLRGHRSSLEEDSVIWRQGRNGQFRVKEAYSLLTNPNDTGFPSRSIWVARVPTKVAFFAWEATWGKALAALYTPSPSKVKALTWLVVYGKVNTNDKLSLRRPYKSLCPQWCILCKGNGESIDHLFLHCPIIIGLWHKLFNLAGLAWVPPRSIVDIMVIAFKGFENSLRGKTLWQIVCLTLLWMVWQERNNRIF